ncbi:hypothetical protein Salat_2687400 [Sesamum alatum]|uniref:Uncharacterized protein n=1 Tax=Sesamum alatum TaxID=300844 RepID=A0AAE1XPR4_9LAMI|nr:hypothetical protein Salat_2687400 [Sesamum alatum]
MVTTQPSAQATEGALVKDDQLQTLPPIGSNFNLVDLVRSEIRRLMTDESSTSHQLRIPFDTTRTNCVRLEEIDEMTGNNLCFNFHIMDSGSWIVDSGATRHAFEDPAPPPPPLPTPPNTSDRDVPSPSAIPDPHTSTSPPIFAPVRRSTRPPTKPSWLKDFVSIPAEEAEAELEEVEDDRLFDDAG